MSSRARSAWARSGVERLIAYRDQASDIAVFGFDDVFGGDTVLILLAQAEAEGMIFVGGVELVPGRGADQCNRIFRRLLRRQMRRRKEKLQTERRARRGQRGERKPILTNVISWKQGRILHPSITRGPCCRFAFEKSSSPREYLLLRAQERAESCGEVGGAHMEPPVQTEAAKRLLWRFSPR